MKLNKEDLIKALEALPTEVLQIALVYAKCNLVDGVDVTQKWNTATEQAGSLKRAYMRGYYDGLERAGTSKAREPKEEQMVEIKRCGNCVFFIRTLGFMIQCGIDWATVQPGYPACEKWEEKPKEEQK